MRNGRDLTDLERSVLEMMLDGPGDTLERLREQMLWCNVSSRQHTGVGVFTELTIDQRAVDSVEGRPSLAISDVLGDVAGLEHGAGFVLFVTDGYLATLETYSYDESWPARIASFSLTYATGDTRDLGALGLG